MGGSEYPRMKRSFSSERITLISSQICRAGKASSVIVIMDYRVQCPVAAQTPRPIIDVAADF